jgi:UDP-N-acetylglucosamine 1-carboxyvinyltransferase
MSELVINGGRQLFGTVIPSGSKNAALPIILSTISTYGISKIFNLPDIGDVRVALALVEGFGASVRRDGDTVTIDTRDLVYLPPDPALVRAIRASTYLIGACLARFGKAALSDFGGCAFCNRPIDLHIYAAEAFGARTCAEYAVCRALKSAEIKFPKRSVGATVNAIIMAASADGCSVIRGCAEESHVVNLIDFLRSAGADISVEGDTVTVCGARLSGGMVRIIPDMIEAGTYLAAGIISGGKVSVDGCSVAELTPYLAALSDAGADICIKDGSVSAGGELVRPMHVITSPYPGYPTDLQPQAAPLMARFVGGRIEERVWAGRFSYLEELLRLGLSYSCSGQVAEIYPSRLVAGSCHACDLRGGAAAMLAALAARGESKIKNAESIMRGYAALEAKLSALGADVTLKKGDT